MKKCTYCGRENDDNATWCAECATKLVAVDPKADPIEPWQKIAVLTHEIEANRLEIELTSRKIPHVIVSHHDSAFDGIFQTAGGWGHLEAPKEHRQTILNLLNDLRDSQA